MAMIVFDITKLETYENIYKWMNEVTKYARPDVQILLVGTKSDLSDKREVSHDMINNITKQLNVKYVETSAKTGSNVDCVFNMICQHLLATSVPHEKSKVSDLVLLTKDEPIAKRSKTCCW
jgi:GTPase SAR1 family protein